MKMLSYRTISFIGFVLTLALLGLSFYLQVYEGFTPCPLCILQRLGMAILAILFLLGVILKKGRLLIAFLAGLISLSGILLAGRQIWLQHLPPNSSADCGMSLQYLMHVLPFDQVIKKVLEGTAECSQTGWQWLGISLAEWSLVWFIFFFIICLVQTVRQPVKIPKA